MWNWEELMDFTFVKQTINLLQQYYDDPTSKTELGKERVNLIDFKSRNEKLLHFGSLYALAQLSEIKIFEAS
ncbi:19676_t:CDS:2 [Dentiscutata erythropus]|uniref:19676_t:CDS:1 n=1 Tax=Dentiscutata erythropus TaxID=1348616 RepID=A0A9N8ZKB1_9GLOM|nr:19676_t:CDS:2 [Dentiscutata erythropus]